MLWKRNNRQFSSSQIIILGFFGVIMAGSLLLTLPAASAGGQVTPFLDALFTATSATCVTGLVVQDTATYWSAFGQAVILCLIQIGGMGVVTVAVSVARISGRRIGLMQRSMMQESISAPQVGGIVSLTGFILRVTLVTELAAAALLMPVFCQDFGIGKGIWYSLFHSISAFCNAGFDLMGVRAKFSSLTSYTAQPVINVVIMFLIIFGGIGFSTWDDFRKNRFSWKRYRVQTKMILAATAALIVLPALYFFFCEFTLPVWDGMSIGEKVWASLFQAVTPRTAGFNSVDFAAFSEAGQLVTVLLMMIGGSPGSTAGGMKTTTMAVLLFSSLAVFRRKEEAECFGRRIDMKTIRYAATILLLYMAMMLAGGILISRLEGLPLLTCMFESASAVGTVGLTLGITQQLCAASRLILVLLMFFGRVGGMTLVFAALAEGRYTASKLPLEKITVG